MRFDALFAHGLSTSGRAPTTFAPTSRGHLFASAFDRDVGRGRSGFRGVYGRHLVLRPPQPVLRLESFDPRLPVGRPARPRERRTLGRPRGVPLGPAAEGRHAPPPTI